MTYTSEALSKPILINADELHFYRNDSRNALIQSYNRRHPIRVALWSWLETFIEAVMTIVAVAAWLMFALVVLMTIYA